MSEFTRVQMMAGISQDELDELKKRIMDMAIVKWSEVTPEERNKLVHEKVMELPLSMPCMGAITWKRDPFNNRERGHWICECGYYGVTDDTLHFGLPSIPAYSTSMAAAWLIVEKMVARQEEEYYTKHFEWDGPAFKPSHRYLTSEGYPLGTTCWYVYIRANDLIEFVCAQTPQDAICLASLKVVGIEVEV